MNNNKPMKKTILSFCLLFSSFLLQTTNAQTTLFTENFGSAALPAGWSNDSMGLPASNLWIFNNQYNRTISGAGFDINFAIFDSDEGSTNDNIDENASLTSPAINIAAATGVLSLEFDEQYRALAGPNTQGSSRRIEITSDGGITWNTLVFDSVNVGYPNPATHTAINISSTLGATNIQVRFTYTGTYDWWWAIDNVTIKSFPSCTVAPNAGSTTTSASSVCAGVNFSLSLAGADSGIVISYQWQSSTDSINWTSISAALSPTLTTSTTVATYYRCVLTCSGFSANSLPVHVTILSPSLCYCVANLGGSGCPSTDVIRNVSIAGTTLNNTDTICNFINGSTLSAFSPVGSATATLIRGNSYSLSVTTTADNIISVWIDYNQNGIYENHEWNQVSTTSTAGVANTINLNIPFGIPGGQTGMRIRSRASGNPNDSTSACANFGSGETEDYTVTIDIGTGIKEAKTNFALAVVPNPASTNLSIIITGTQAETAELKLINVQGQLVYNELIQCSGKYAKNLDVSAFAKGIYTLQMINSSGVINKKVVLE